MVILFAVMCPPCQHSPSALSVHWGDGAGRASEKVKQMATRSEREGQTERERGRERTRDRETERDQKQVQDKEDSRLPTKYRGAAMTRVEDDEQRKREDARETGARVERSGETAGGERPRDLQPLDRERTHA